jgi:LmbE family N-acetylglucosaminyl deacetylase
MNPYQRFVSDFKVALDSGKAMPLGGFPSVKNPARASDAPKALFFAPHPDDECISGGLAVRLLREAGMQVINVAVTQGSKKERQAERWVELKAACDYLGFGLEATGPHGLEKVNPKTRLENPAHWSASVRVILDLLKNHLPRVILFPHEQDWNSTHIGTYLLVTDALKLLPPDFECYAVETEFWGQMATPNLMAEISETDLADMIAATSFHVGEVKRNPYHLLLPAWTMDNVRRGTELVGGQGGEAPDFTFAALYRLRKWQNGELRHCFAGGKQISKKSNVGELFE